MINSYAVRMHEVGDPEVLVFEHHEVPDVGTNEILIRHEAIGLNFIDTYHRTGQYPLPLPAVIGMEGAGVVEAVGAAVDEFKVGDRVAYPAGPPGAYADRRVIAASRVVKLPDDIDSKTAAAIGLKGGTVEMLLHRVTTVKAGQTILLHAAAGGVGMLMVQWAKALGVTVIGTVGNDEKADIVRALGCDHVIVYTKENFQTRVRELTDGKGVDVVYDSIGQATFEGSINSLKPRGTMVSFGNATGAVAPVPPGLLAAKGSLFLTRPVLLHYYSTADEIREGSNRVFEMVRSGKVKVRLDREFELRDAAAAHRFLEDRRSIGSSILVPSEG